MRTAILLALLACAAQAEDFIVRVTAADEPVHNATIKVLKANDRIVFDRMNWAVDKLTDESGQAVVKVPEGGRVLVYVPGYALAVVEADRIPLDVELKLERIYAGRVVDTAGKPIAGASVTLNTTFKRQATFPATTDKQGRFFVYGLWLDRYAVRVSAPGYVPSDVGPVFHLIRTGSVAGRVTDTNRKPLAGIALEGHSAKTGEDGTYRIESVSPGPCWIRPEWPWGGYRTVKIKEGEHLAGVDLVLLRPATYTMHVVGKTNKPIAGVRLQLSVNGRDQIEPLSDKDGRIEFRARPNHTYRNMRLTAKRFFEQEFDVGPAQPGASRDLGVRVLEAHEPATLTVLLPDGKRAQEGKVDDVAIADGAATLPVIGTYLVQVPGYPMAYAKAPGSVRLATPLYLDGIVLDADGRPAAGAVVVVGPHSKATAPMPRSLLVAMKTDAAGVFRIGPFGERKVHAVAHKGDQSAGRTVRISEGRLELRLSRPSRELVRGAVTRNGSPVEEFQINGRKFLDEHGAFEILVDRASRAWLAVSVDYRSYRFALPPPGELFSISLPTGRLRVRLDPPEPNLVDLTTASGLHVAEETDKDGIAEFEGLADAVYQAWALGYEEVEVRLGQTVVLRRERKGRVRLRVPAGLRINRPLVVTLVAGVQDIGHVAEGPFDIRVYDVTIRAGEETLVDLVGQADVVIRGKPGSPVDLVGDLPDARAVWSGTLDRSGVLRLRTVPSGLYLLRSGKHRFRVDVGTDPVEVVLGQASHAFTGRVMLAGRGPAQGATVQLLADDDRTEIQAAVTDLLGRFRFKDLPPGEYTCVAHLRGFARGQAGIVVTETAVAPEGFPIILKKSASAPLVIRGLAGEPVAQIWLRVNGIPRTTDELGTVLLDTLPATIDLELRGYATIRDVTVTRPGEIRLQRGADLVVLLYPEVGELEVLVDGQPWELPRTIGERLVLRDLPPGPVQITQTPEEREDEESEPQIVQTKLIAGGQVTVDLRD